MWIRQYAPVSVICGKHETESVRLAVENLKRDLRRVLNCQLEEGLAEGVLESEKADESESKKECEPENGKEGASENEKEGVSEIGKGVPGREQENPPGAVLRIIVGTTGQTDEIVHDAGLERLRDEEGNLRKEAFLLQEKNGELFIMGSDRRGTIYGIYEFCEKWLGVSPWYFFADVPVRAKQEVEIPSGFVQADWPSVEYRGIFINDEEELEHWVQRYMGEPTIGVKTYEKIFELLLRLKMNYIWPAMHMRGIHDSGFEVRALEGKTGRELLEAKIELLDSVIKTQEELLRENLGKETVKTFVPYKEVLELYDNGLEVPEDLTLIWVNDNYGYVRRYPGEKEKRRRGGNGLYYHNSYWAPPGGSYLFICSIPLSHTRNELKKAYEEGIRKIWVTNFGAMKPLEQQMSFYAAYAWEAGREGALTEDEQAFLRQWIDRTFSGGYGAELAPILTEFDQLTNARKVEQMDFDAFSQTAWGDEAAGRIHRYEEMFAVVNRIWKSLPEEEQDAFFQMIGMKVHAAYYTNLMYYYADRSNLCMAQGKKKAARKYTDLCREFDHARRSMLHYYNHVMAGGKWNGILTPEDFPPPRTAMHPACMPPVGELSPVEEILSAEDTLEYMPLNGDALSSGEELSAEEIPLAGKGPREGGDGSEGGKVGAEGSRKCNFIVTKWNDGQEIVFTQPAVKWIEIGNEGNAPVKYRLSGPDWIRFAETGTSEAECLVDTEARVLFAPDRDKVLALQEAAVEPSCRKAAGQLEAAVEPSGQKTVGRQEAVVEPSGRKTVGQQEAAVEPSVRKAVGQQGAAVESSVRKAGGQQENPVELSDGKAAGQQKTSVEPSGQVTAEQLEAFGCQTSRLSGFIRIQDWEGRTVDSVPVSVRFGQRGETAAAWKESKAFKWKEKEFSGAGKETRSMEGIKQGTEAFRGTGQQPSRDFLGSVEDDGRICAEAEDGRICSETEQIGNGTEQIKNYGEAVQGRSFGEAEQSKGCEEASPDGLFEETAPGGTCENSAGWKRIPNLGRDSGSLLEAREPGAQVSWQVTVLTPGSHLLELHRFPSLNSVGAIQVGVSVDQGPVQILESESNDEYRGSWKENIRNNVDKIYLRLPHMEAGTHRITFHAMSRYFAFTRFVIYTGERRENSLGREGGDQRLPQAFDIRGFVEENYGKEAVSLLPRPVLYLPENPRGGTLDAEDIMVQPSAWGKPVKAEELVESGRSLPGEKDGRLLIECGAALADTAFARMENYRWQWCASPSHGETGLALYIREYGKHWTDAADAPALRYLFRVQGGNYNIWIRAMMWGDDTCHFTIGLDGELVPESTLYGGRGIWRYSNEQVWKWIPVWKAQLTEGEHELRIVTFSSRLRFEQVYITDGGELPPALG
ncbi:MAG: hypothetical protein HFH85_12695 [Lachnospiraceae bacterium]|jgi:hypothetical protein|nr:hypothetical protein [Lachnospiraceae bacterium]